MAHHRQPRSMIGGATAQRSLVLLILLVQSILVTALRQDSLLATGRRRLSSEDAQDLQLVSLAGVPNEHGLNSSSEAKTVGFVEGDANGGVAFSRHLQEDGEDVENVPSGESSALATPSVPDSGSAESGDATESPTLPTLPGFEGQSLPDQTSAGALPPRPPSDQASAGALPPRRPPDQASAGAFPSGVPPDQASTGSADESASSADNEAGTGNESESGDGADGEDGDSDSDEDGDSDSDEDGDSDSDEDAESTDSDEGAEDNSDASGDSDASNDADEEIFSSDESASDEADFTLDELSLEAISLSSCQKIDFAVAYLTSLEFDGSLVANAKSGKDSSTFWSDVYYFEMIVVPVSLLLAFFGSHLLFLASVLTAFAFGTFLVFHFVNGFFDGGLNCKVKLGLSSVSAGISAFMAVKFVRFGLFTLGAVATGLCSYMFFDAFPAFDPGTSALDGAKYTEEDVSYLAAVMNSSDISPVAWAITIVLALFTGICIRVYEQASVEVLTAVLGGVGIGYSTHSFILIHGGKLNRSIAFFLAALIAVLGWRFQRRSRMRKSANKTRGGSLPQWQATSPSSGASWEQLQSSIDSTNALLQQNGDDEVAMELAGLLNSFQENVKERGKGD